MILLKVNIRRDKFNNLTKDERVFFILLTRVLNDLNILQKCAIFCGSEKPIDEAQVMAQVFQTLFFIRMLAGVLNEGWEMIKRDFLGKKLGLKYTKALSQEGQDSLSHLKRYFGKNNLVNFVRNQFAYHYLPQKIEEEINQMGQYESLTMYVSKHLGNCLYSGSEAVVNRVILNHIDSSNLEKAMNRLREEITIRVSGWFQKFG
ncbi:MAG: hypothetical protein ACYS0I_22090, partial [Planctomycetota bacterium]